MDMRESRLAWSISGVLLVLLVIVTYLWLSQKNLPTVLQDGHDAIAAEQAQIAKDCVDQNSDACRQDLSDLEDILRQFSSDLEKATTVSTTTPY